MMQMLEALRQNWNPQPPSQLTVSSASLYLAQGASHRSLRAQFQELAGRLQAVALEVAEDLVSNAWSPGFSRLLRQQLSLLVEIAQILEGPEPWRCHPRYACCSQELIQVQDRLERFGLDQLTCANCGFEGEFCPECGVLGLLLDDLDLEQNQDFHWVSGPVLELYQDLCSVLSGQTCLSVLDAHLDRIGGLVDRLNSQPGTPDLQAMLDGLALLDVGVSERRVNRLVEGWKRLLEGTIRLQAWQESQSNQGGRKP